MDKITRIVMILKYYNKYEISNNFTGSITLVVKLNNHQIFLGTSTSSLAY